MNNTALETINSGAASAAPSSTTHGVYRPPSFTAEPLLTRSADQVKEALAGNYSGVTFDAMPRSLAGCRAGRRGNNRF